MKDQSETRLKDCSGSESFVRLDVGCSGFYYMMLHPPLPWAASPGAGACRFSISWRHSSNTLPAHEGIINLCSRNRALERYTHWRWRHSSHSSQQTHIHSSSPQLLPPPSAPVLHYANPISQALTLDKSIERTWWPDHSSAQQWHKEYSAGR